MDNAHPAHPAHHGVVNAVAPLSAVPSQLMYAGHVYPGPASNVIAMQPKTQLESAFFMPDEMRSDILARNEISNLIMDAAEAAQHSLPLEVDNYHALYPLEPPAQPMHTKLTLPASTYRATHNSTGLKYCLRRLHGEIGIYILYITLYLIELCIFQDSVCSPQSVWRSWRCGRSCSTRMLCSCAKCLRRKHLVITVSERAVMTREREREVYL